MLATKRAGGIASLVLGVLFLALTAILMALPSIGLGPGTLDVPATGIPFIETSLLPTAISLLYLGMAGVIVLLALALVDRLKDVSPALMPIVSVAGTAAGILFLGYAMIDLVGHPATVSAYHADPAIGGSVYVALRAVGHALSAGALFATGTAIGLSGWSAWRSKRLPVALAWVLILAGGACVLSFIVLPLGLLALLMAPVWSIWLGIVLLQKPRERLSARTRDAAFAV
jgi:hypothetical protein